MSCMVFFSYIYHHLPLKSTIHVGKHIIHGSIMGFFGSNWIKKLPLNPRIPRCTYMDVSENRVFSQKSSILIGFSLINHSFWGTPIFGNTHIPHGCPPFFLQVARRMQSQLQSATRGVHQMQIRCFFCIGYTLHQLFVLRNLQFDWLVLPSLYQKTHLYLIRLQHYILQNMWINASPKDFLPEFLVVSAPKTPEFSSYWVTPATPKHRNPWVFCSPET